MAIPVSLQELQGYWKTVCLACIQTALCFNFELVWLSGRQRRRSFHVFPNGSLECRPCILGLHRNVFPGGSSGSVDISDVFIIALMWSTSAVQFSSVSN